MNAGEWRQAIECFEEIQHLEPGYRDAGRLLSEARQRQSTDQEERVRPDDSTDARRRSSLPVLAESWWVLALRGLVLVTLGLLIAVYPGKESHYSYLGYGLLIMADGALANIAIGGAGRRPLLRIQGSTGVLAGVVILIAAGLLLSLPKDVTSLVHLIKIIHGSVVVWAVCIGIIRTVTAIRYGWEFKVVRFMAISGALLMVAGIIKLLNLGNLGDQDLPQWLLIISLLSSGGTLVAFAFQVRNLQGSGAAR